MNAYFLSHNGLGDNLFSIGALYFLLNYYNNIHFLCKDIYYENNKLFFEDEPRIICVPFDSNNEFIDCENIIKNNYNYNDIFICGIHKNNLKSKITNTDLLKYNRNDLLYKIDHDLINTNNFNFVKDIYNDINLDLSITFDYWKLPKSLKSIELYNLIKEYYIIFLQTKCSDGRKLNISSLINKIYDKNCIFISTDVNLYNDFIEEDMILKKNICEKFVNEKLVYYLDTIINSNEIYIIDSCFIGIILPLKKRNILKSNIVRIIPRNLTNDIIL